MDGAEAVFPADFLAFLVGSSIVGDAHFIDADAFETGDFGGHFGLEAETLLLEVYALDDICPEQFIAGLHVGEVQVGEHVGQESEEAVAP